MVARRELGGADVARRRLGVAALADEVVGLAGEAVGVGEVEEALDLVERLGVVLDAQVDGQPPRLALGRRDDDRRRLAAAHVAAGALGRPQRGDETARERPGRRLEARAIAGQTSALAIMFAWTLKPSPDSWPANAMHDAPVWVATRPWASTAATWRNGGRSSSAVRRVERSCGRAALASRSSAFGP